MARVHELHPQTRGHEAPDARLEEVIYETVFRYQLPVFSAKKGGEHR
jgi:hypothetical protein